MFSMVNTEFPEWLQAELDKREWSQADLARKSGLSRSAISNIMSDNRQPGPDACSAIARAFDLPPEVVFRAAGLLPQEPDKPLGLIEWTYLYLDATEEERAQLMEIARALGRNRKSREQKGGTRPVTGTEG